jgi:hypothetical protein
MTSPYLVFLNILDWVFVPLLIASPLIFTLCFKTKNPSPAARDQIRARTALLTICTLLAIALSLALTLGGTLYRIDILRIVGRFTWMLFFPLWFGLAMPLIKLKNPLIDAPLHTSTEFPVRAASLVNRQRRSPIKPWHWILLAFLALVGAVPIILHAFTVTPSSTSQPTSISSLWMLAAYALAVALTAGLLPFLIRITLHEPEPLDAAGDPRLQELYDRFRQKRARSMYWALGVGSVTALALSMALALWAFSGPALGMFGAIAGTVLGLIGAWMGISASSQRARIEEFRRSLSAPNPTSPT